MLDRQIAQILDATDPVEERVRKMSGTTLRSVGHIGRWQNPRHASYVTPQELRDDNRKLTRLLRLLHSRCGEHGKIVTASLVENWTDQKNLRGVHQRQTIEKSTRRLWISGSKTFGEARIDRR
jgi:starvation-inducible DNA-binding protein